MLLCCSTSNYSKCEQSSCGSAAAALYRKVNLPLVPGNATDLHGRLSAGFYLISPSEFERFSLSTRFVVEPRCLVEPPLNSAASQRRRQPDGASSPGRHVRSSCLSPPLASSLSSCQSLICPLSPSRTPRQDAEDAGNVAALRFP